MLEQLKSDAAVEHPNQIQWSVIQILELELCTLLVQRDDRTATLIKTERATLQKYEELEKDVVTEKKEMRQRSTWPNKRRKPPG